MHHPERLQQPLYIGRQKLGLGRVRWAHGLLAHPVNVQESETDRLGTGLVGCVHQDVNACTRGGELSQPFHQGRTFFRGEAVQEVPNQHKVVWLIGVWWQRPQRRSPRLPVRWIREQVSEADPPGEAAVQAQTRFRRRTEVQHRMAPVLAQPGEKCGDPGRGPLDGRLDRFLRG